MLAQAHGHAQLAQVAVGTGDFDGLGIHGLSLGCAMDLPWIKTLAYSENCAKFAGIPGLCRKSMKTSKGFDLSQHMGRCKQAK
jgi:hypothetical protein